MKWGVLFLGLLVVGCSAKADMLGVCNIRIDYAEPNMHSGVGCGSDGCFCADGSRVTQEQAEEFYKECHCDIVYGTEGDSCLDTGQTTVRWRPICLNQTYWQSTDSISTANVKGGKE